MEQTTRRETGGIHLYANQGEDQNNKVDGGMDVRRVHGVKDIHKNNQRKV